MKPHFSTVTSKGQVTIPLSIRDKLHLFAGSKIEFIIQNNSFAIVPINRSVTELCGALPKPSKAFSIEEMNKAIKGRYDRN
jgi:AbrB family looped-hinge helix DNA binding protein